MHLNFHMSFLECPLSALRQLDLEHVQLFSPAFLFNLRAFLNIPFWSLLQSLQLSSHPPNTHLTLILSQYILLT